MTTSSGNIFCVTGPLWGESTGHRMPLLPSIISQHRDGTWNPPSWNIRTRSLLMYYNDVIMDAIKSQITSLIIVCSTVYSDGDQRKHLKLRVTGLCAGNSPATGEFSAQMASKAEIFPFDDVIMSWTNTDILSTELQEHFSVKSIYCSFLSRKYISECRL